MNAMCLSAYRQIPMLVALPANTEQVSRILAWCHANGVKVVPRGAGTGLSDALPLADAITLGLSRFNRIFAIDWANRCVVAQPGITNLAITKAVEHAGLGQGGASPRPLPDLPDLPVLAA